MAGGTTINFKNNCIICLLPENPQKMLEILQNNPKNLRTFQPVVHYLTGTDPTFGKSAEECTAYDLPVMRNLPPLCENCYEVTSDIYRLHAELLELQLGIQQKTEKLRGVVWGTRRGRGSLVSVKTQFLDRLRKSGMDEVQVLGMDIFLEKFHGRISVQGAQKVIFPRHPPPNYLPLPKNQGPPQQPLVLVQIPVQQLQKSSTTTPTLVTGTTTTATASNVPSKATTAVIIPSPVSTQTTASTGVRIPPASRTTPPISKSQPITVPSILRSTSLISSQTVVTSRPSAPTISTRSSDIVMIPGSSTIKFENEDEEEDEQPPGMEGSQEDDQEDTPLQPEVVIKAESDDEEVVVLGDDPPPKKSRRPLGGNKEDSDWEPEEDEDEVDNEEDTSEEEEGPSKTKRRRPSLTKSASAGQSGLPKPLAPSQPQALQFPLQLITPSGEVKTVISATPIILAGGGNHRRKQVLPKTKEPEPPKPTSTPEPSPTPSGEPEPKKAYYKRRLPEKVECDICDLRFPPNLLPSHVRDHLGGVDGHQCPSCFRTFLSHSKLLLHWHVRLCGNELRLANKLNDTIICPTCPPPPPSNPPQKFTVFQYRDHVFSTHEKDNSIKKTHSCVFCSSSFRTLAGLDFHLNLHCHLKRRYPTWHVNICPPAPSPLSLSEDDNHQELTKQESEKKFKCFVCQQGFRSKVELLRHEVIHTDKWPHRCRYCDGKFRESASLSYHYQRAHPEHQQEK